MSDAPHTERFTVRASTVFLGLSGLSVIIVLTLGKGVQDDRLAPLLFIVFPWSALLAAVSATAYLVKNRSLQAWVEFVLSAALIAVALLLFPSEGWYP